MDKYKKIKMIILDVDGTLTDGGIIYDSMGNESKRFDVKDGLAIKVAIAAGLEIAILTGRHSAMVARRAEELQISCVLEGVQAKITALKQIMEERQIRKDEIFYIGDDWNDLQCMECVGLKGCPADADKDVKIIADFISTKPGGYGAVRECIEYLLEARNEWKKFAKTIYYSI